VNILNRAKNTVGSTGIYACGGDVRPELAVAYESGIHTPCGWGTSEQNSAPSIGGRTHTPMGNIGAVKLWGFRTPRRYTGDLFWVRRLSASPRSGTSGIEYVQTRNELAYGHKNVHVLLACKALSFLVGRVELTLSANLTHRPVVAESPSGRIIHQSNQLTVQAISHSVVAADPNY
jgi:hypothetical protein